MSTTPDGPGTRRARLTRRRDGRGRLRGAMPVRAVRGGSLWAVVASWLLAGVILGGIGAFEVNETVQLARHGTQTTAVVTTVVPGRGSYMSARYEVQGTLVEADTGRFAGEQVGDRVVIVYDRTDPDRFQTLSSTGVVDDYALPIAAVFFGAVALGVGVSLVVRSARAARGRRTGG